MSIHEYAVLDGKYIESSLLLSILIDYFFIKALK